MVPNKIALIIKSHLNVNLQENAGLGKICLHLPIGKIFGATRPKIETGKRRLSGVQRERKFAAHHNGLKQLIFTQSSCHGEISLLKGQC